MTATLHPYAAYWDRGIRSVPDMTGAAHLLDCRDLAAMLGDFGIGVPLADVLDVGCGTGRASQLCTKYVGVDISPSAVQYCRERGLAATLISGPADLAALRADTVLCLSVFTHIGGEERLAYLRTFATVCRQLVVDIISGHGGGDVERWTTEPGQFLRDLAACGWTVLGVRDYQWGAAVTDTSAASGRRADANVHTYHHCIREGA